MRSRPLCASRRPSTRGCRNLFSCSGCRRSLRFRQPFAFHASGVLDDRAFGELASGGGGGVAYLLADGSWVAFFLEAGLEPHPRLILEFLQIRHSCGLLSFGYGKPVLAIGINENGRGPRILITRPDCQVAFSGFAITLSFKELDFAFFHPLFCIC